MLKKTSICAAFVLAFLFSNAQQNDSSRMVIADLVTLHSKVLNEDRKIQIYTPALSNWDKFQGLSLPVLYLLDGDALTALVASEVNYLSTSYHIIPPMIIVGVSNYDHNRLHDLTPSVPKDGFGGVTEKNAFGGAEKFIQFISSEVFPYIDSNYKTDPFRILVGHSMGGLLSFYCLIRHPELFNAYLAISPSLWWDSVKVLGTAKNQLEQSTLKSRFLFFSDANEGSTMHSATQKLDSMLIQKNLVGLSYKYVNYPNESHGSEPVKAVYDALNWLYPNWYPALEDSTAFLVETHFNLLSQKYGYKILPPEWFVTTRGTRILQNGRIDDAIAIFELNTKNYPTSAKGFFLLGNAWLKKHDSTKAMEFYKIAAKLSPGSKEIEEKMNSLKQ